MNAFLDSLIQWNLAIQGWGDWLTAPMSFLSFLGQEEFYLLIMPALLWCWDAAAGLRVGVMLLLSAGINSISKLAFHSPRPFWYDSNVTAISHESSFGLPSGHSQNAVAVWGAMAVSLQKKWAWILAFALMFLIGLSRLYLGVHFLHDVLLGWTIGALMLWGLIRLEAPIKKWIGATKSPRSQMGIIFMVSITLVLIGAVITLSLSGWQPPAVWEQNANFGVVDVIEFNPVANSMEGLLTNTGAFLGLAAGAIWLNTRGGFNAKGKITQLVARYFLGLIGVIVLWRGLSMIFPSGDTFTAYSLRYIRYALVGFWMSAGAPLLFMRWGLAEPANVAKTSPE